MLQRSRAHARRAAVTLCLTTHAFPIQKHACRTWQLVCSRSGYTMTVNAVTEVRHIRLVLFSGRLPAALLLARDISARARVRTQARARNCALKTQTAHALRPCARRQLDLLFAAIAKRELERSCASRST